MRLISAVSGVQIPAPPPNFKRDADFFFSFLFLLLFRRLPGLRETGTFSPVKLNRGGRRKRLPREKALGPLRAFFIDASPFWAAPEKMNIEHRTSNIECLMRIDMVVCFSLDVRCSMFDVHWFWQSGFLPRAGG